MSNNEDDDIYSDDEDVDDDGDGSFQDPDKPDLDETWGGDIPIS